MSRNLSAACNLHIALALALAFFLASCAQDQPPKNDVTTSSPPTIARTETLDISTVSTELLNKQLLLTRYTYFKSVERWEGEEIWLLGTPFRQPTAFSREDNYRNGSAVWSHNGKKLAYSRSMFGCPIPSSAIWITEASGSNPQLVKEVSGRQYECSGEIPTHLIVTRSWLVDDSLLAVDVLEDDEDYPRMHPYILNPDTGELVSPYPQAMLKALGLNNDYAQNELAWMSIAPSGNWALLTTSTKPTESNYSGEVILILLNFKDDTQSKIIELPANFNPRLFYIYSAVTWSPDEKHLLVPENSDIGRHLWQMSLDDARWAVVFTDADLPAPPITSSSDRYSGISVSPDGLWFAEWEFSGDFYEIRFVNTETWMLEFDTSVKRGYRASTPLGWVESSGGSYFTVWSDVLGGGLTIIDPTRNQPDTILISYDNLVSWFDITDLQNEYIDAGPWQP